jgi:lipid-binding SYLF domain-containing protein
LNGLQVIVLGGSTSTMLGKLGVAEAAHGNNLDADVSSQPSI